MSKLETISASTPLGDIPGVGGRLNSSLERMDLRVAGDLVRHLPTRYEHELAEQSIRNALEAVRDGETGNLALRGTIQVIRRARGRRPRIEATLEDDSGTAQLVWFNAGWVVDKLHPGHEVLITGRGGLYRDELQFSNPRFTIFDSEESPVDLREEGLRPVYPASEDIPSPKIAALVDLVLKPLVRQIKDPLPDAYRLGRHLMPLADAYRAIHAPHTEEEAARARHRLAFDELLLLQLGVMMRRHHLRHRLRAPQLRWDDELDARIRARFPFLLTPAQMTVIGEIAGDLAGTAPMNRLLQGDVGAGKTVVALHGMLTAVASGHQAALMAPTELLAEQHLSSIRAMLAESDVDISLLSGTLPEKIRRDRLDRIASGDIDIVIGTHALLTENVRFKSLALAVIDEQHRFGVVQRAALREKSDEKDRVPHVLVMTATPIPRTLSLTLFGDLDISVIKGRLPDRLPPTTRVVSEDKRTDVYEFVAERLHSGEQAYVVVPAIDESDLGLKNVNSHLEFLKQGMLAGLTLEAMHGRLNAEEREAVMERFRDGRTQCLVATVVIEVGVDVPNATVMVIEHAERFGLAQLHQLRGRIGRGTKRGVCALVGTPVTEEARRRLEAIANTDDGFKIAELDLSIRGPGELFGARQSGLPPFRVANLLEDGTLLNEARSDARAWIDRSHDLAAPEEALLRKKLMAVYGEALEIGDVG